VNQAVPQASETDRPRDLGEVPLSLLDANPLIPAGARDGLRIEQLAAGLRQGDTLEPLLVRPRGGRYEVLAGEVRRRAALSAGRTRVPVDLRDVGDEELLEVTLIENLRRGELGPLQQAQAIERLQRQLSQTQIALRLSRNRSTISNTLRLLGLSRAVRDFLDAGRITVGHARPLLGLLEDQQKTLALEAAAKRLSARAVEVRAAKIRAALPSRRCSPKDPNTRAAEERLHSVVGARIEIHRRRKGGTVRLHFATENELNRIYETLMRLRRPK
jgi:ParB family transcriptional regulator, chromosome partitioning protein